MYAEQAGKSEKAAIITINDRLNKTLETLSYQCERIESVLSRVNGTPQKIENAKTGSAPPVTSRFPGAPDPMTANSPEEFQAEMWLWSQQVAKAAIKEAK